MFLLNSRLGLFTVSYSHRNPFSLSYRVNLPSSFNIILSSALVCSTSPPVSVWGTVYKLGLFPGRTSAALTIQLAKTTQMLSVISSRLRNIYLIPIDYDFRPHLRGRLTLRGLPLRRKPWTFGGNVFHISLRYSCQHSHF